MKRIIFLGFLVALPVWAGPLQKSEVSGDAKWLVHLDFDAFRQTRVGTFFGKEIVDNQLAALKKELKFDFNKLFQQIHSVTAFGDYQGGPEKNGVALIKLDREAKKAVDGLLLAQVLANKSNNENDNGNQNANAAVREVQQTPYPIYAVKEGVFISPYNEEAVLVGKSQAQIDKSRELLAGKGKSLATSKAFADFPEVQNSFFFLAVAEGFANNTPMPPQARIFQMADGGRLVVGERTDKLFVNLSLRGKTAEVTRQIQQVIEGMLALVNLGQSENKELMQLVQAVKVSGSDRMVHLGIEYPLADAIEKIAQKTKAKTKAANDE